LAPLFPWWNQAELLAYLVEIDFCGEKFLFGEIGRSDVLMIARTRSRRSHRKENRHVRWIFFGGSFMVFRGKEIPADFIFHERI
jgi:hypothetical protein